MSSLRKDALTVFGVLSTLFTVWQMREAFKANKHQREHAELKQILMRIEKKLK
jgi:hypothetical protein